MAYLFEFANITKKLNNDNKMLKISGQVDEGQILILKGPSGSGKSTLLKVLARLIRADAGTVVFKGNEWSSVDPIEWRKNVLYVSQKPVLFNGTVKDNFVLPFSFSSYKLNKARFNLQLAQKYLSDVNLSTEFLEQDAKKISGGEGARVALIRALLINPSILMLDEPNAYLDKESREKVNNLLLKWLQGNTGKAIIMITHNDEDFKLSTNINYLTIQGS
ncbi:hypothetical protein SYNTR_0097 [Candidatus Syntrophocurvum alkaliphilum]|uniref:ABC transporter domain-containing protein n=1 Tax=Candidatus Syntrophocurvum alkaliphilum TaxID=2293317 RepID=A0A6I6DBZ3_9FIRM|nr:ATP-binding cassette domain-containing protein [Candidatus Syntrophocurvum alkaliphilum]QGT98690.1 hypothetical protein SYNTR_0097 [Candidatus Syntrophocurvum alkaliphilum]